MMTIRIDKYTLIHAAAIIGSIAIIYGIWATVSAITKDKRTENYCERSCDTFKAEIFHSQCFCATAGGWTPADKARLVDAKVKGKR